MISKILVMKPIATHMIRHTYPMNGRFVWSSICR